MAVTLPRKAAGGPPRSLKRYLGFLHLLARFYMNYDKAIHRAAKRKGHRRAVDVDVQLSAQGTMWALHWATVGNNKLRDPFGEIRPSARIENLTDSQIASLRGPNGQKPHKVAQLVTLAASLNVRLELELKTLVPITAIKEILNSLPGKFLVHRDHLQFKTRAGLIGWYDRLKNAKVAGGKTILTFEGYRGQPIDPVRAGQVADYFRGKPDWS